MALGEYRVIWSTPGGGTGYSVLHFADGVSSDANAQSIANAVRGFFDSIKGLFPNEVTWSFDSEYLELNVDGTLEGVFAVTPPAALAGTGAGTYNRAAGVRLDWGTGQIVAGRRLVGRTYLVPADAGAFDSNGLVTSANSAALIGAANALRTAVSGIAQLAVWSRTHQVVHAVSAVSVPSKGAILTGRRD